MFNRKELAEFFNQRLDRVLADRGQTFSPFWLSLGYALHRRKRADGYWLPKYQHLAEIAMELGVTCDYLLGLTEESNSEYLAKESHDTEDVEFSAFCRFDDLVYDEKLSAKQISAAADCTDNVPYTWIRDELAPGTYHLYRLCAAFGISFDYMIGLTEVKALPVP